MVNADATERLRAQTEAVERQARGQRDLLQITESILTTLDARAVLDQVADRLAVLVGYDNIAIETVDPGSGLLTPLTARGIHAAQYIEPWEPGEAGIAPWVVEHNEPVLILDERTDERINHFRDEGTMDGSLIVVPLRGRDGATGVLTLERLGVGNVFTSDEFELVQLFAAQVSIALQNAEVHQTTEQRARTDGLTGLLNHATSATGWRRRSGGASGSVS
jgi:GAF domain-containing protein